MYSIHQLRYGMSATDAVQCLGEPNRIEGRKWDWDYVSIDVDEHGMLYYIAGNSFERYNKIILKSGDSYQKVHQELGPAQDMDSDGMEYDWPDLNLSLRIALVDDRIVKFSCLPSNGLSPPPGKTGPVTPSDPLGTLQREEPR